MESVENAPPPEGTASAKQVRWGVLSTSKIGRVSVNPAIRAARGASLRAVASRSLSAAREFAAREEIPRAYGSYEDLLADPEIDAVYIPLPNSLHLEWVLKAAAAGKHILCEKPLALSEAECLQMDATAREHGVRLMEAFMYRFHPRIGRVLERLQGGAIGEVRVIRSSFTFHLKRPADIRWDPQLGGGSLMDVGCYCVNLSRTIVGAEPIEVQAQANWTDRGVDRELVGVLRFPGDVLAHFDCAFSVERGQFCEIGGTEGQMLLPAVFRPGKGDAVIRTLRGNEEVIESVPGTDEYREMVEDFSAAILENRPVRYPASEAALNLRTIEALARSARDGGRPVRLSEESA